MKKKKMSKSNKIEKVKKTKDKFNNKLMTSRGAPQ